MRWIRRNRFYAMAGILAVGIGFPMGCAKPEETTASSSTASGMSGTEATRSMPHAAEGMAMNDTSMTMGSSGQDALKSLSGKEFNIAYLSQMIAHHQAALDMANEALQTAQRRETKTEAQAVVTNQTKEIQQMTRWLHDWYGVRPSAKQMDLVNADMKSMTAMKITDDKMFFEMMEPHHQGAIDMSKLALKQSDKSEVKELAQHIITAQEAEMARYKTLLKQIP